MNGRKAGILMHISSLPGKYGVGTLGKKAFDFVDFLKSSGMSIWQTLPLLPTGYGDSPYQACANYALNFYFIDFDILKKQGLLEENDYSAIEWGCDERRTDYGKLFTYKAAVLRKAYDRFNKTNEKWKEFLTNGKYLDFAVFMTVKRLQNFKACSEWDEKYKNYSDELFENIKTEHLDEVCFWQFTQFIFLQQWQALKTYANENGVSIMGDMPIYVSADSVEMWKYKKQLFLLDESGNPALQAGVPPDAFSADGQLWGNPVYNWELMKSDGYKWWRERILYEFELFDIVRIDHFRGFDRFFAIPIGDTTAKNGKWLPAPGAELFKGMENLNIVAEDLGVIDEGVIQMLEKIGYPGMRVAEFSFDGNVDNPHKTSNMTENCIAYTGTHDNQPLKAFLQELTLHEGKNFIKDLKKECKILKVKFNNSTIEETCETVIKTVFASKASACILPMQDVLLFGAESRMNFPSSLSTSNWTFRFIDSDFKKETAEYLKKLVKKYNRA